MRVLLAKYTQRVSGNPGGGVRAAVTATTVVAPAARSAAAAAASVAPVVATSSTSSTREGARRRATKCGPTRRAAASRPVCGGPGLSVEQARTSGPQLAGDGPGEDLRRIEAAARDGAAPWWAPS